jgi:hypothetical protein
VGDCDNRESRNATSHVTVEKLLRFTAFINAMWPVAPTLGVILYGTSDPTANTTAPTGALAGSGWQYEGQFGAFLGTVIASNYFVTAKHIGGSVGQTFTFDGVTYTTTAVFPDPSSDLQIWQVSGMFPSHAPIYSGAASSETNRSLVVFGRGTQRGNPVFVGSDSHLGGWLWGSSDGVQRWGTNLVGSIITDPTYGKLLRVPFDANVGPNEGHLSVGDSGGGVFVFNTDNNVWELAGINLAVDGPFSISSSGANPFDAAMFDTTGLFAQGMAAPNPSAFYATEVAANKGFIESVVMQLVSLVSRKTHGNAGTFDISLPESGMSGIECRGGGPEGNYLLVFTFMNNVSVQGASVTSGTGSVANFSVVGNQVTVNLTAVTNAQTIVVDLNSVSDGVNTSDVQATMGVLLGDVDGSGRVDSTDVFQVRQQSLQTVNASNFRDDLDLSGRIDSNDVFGVRQQNLTSLPSEPTTSAIRITPLPRRDNSLIRTMHARIRN